MPTPVDSTAFDPPQAADEIGRIGRYRVLRQLGAGGMGLVYLAENRATGEAVALKFMTPEVASQPVVRERFVREAQSAARVQCEYVVRLLAVEQAGGVPFIVMERLEGQTLQDVLDAERLPALPTAVRIGSEVAAGLAAVHDVGLVHRDVKPGNIFLEAPHGRAKLLDFGLAHDASRNTRLTQPGQALGTSEFMAPEQVAGGEIDGRADLFSLGVVLYQLTTGIRPFARPTAAATLAAVLTVAPRPVRELNPTVPERLADLIEGLLAKDAAHRIPSADWVSGELGRIAAALRSVNSVPVPVPASGDTAADRPLGLAPTVVNWTPGMASLHEPRQAEPRPARYDGWNDPLRRYRRRRATRRVVAYLAVIAVCSVLIGVCANIVSNRLAARRATVTPTTSNVAIAKAAPNTAAPRPTTPQFPPVARKTVTPPRPTPARQSPSVVHPVPTGEATIPLLPPLPPVSPSTVTEPAPTVPTPNRPPPQPSPPAAQNSPLGDPLSQMPPTPAAPPAEPGTITRAVLQRAVRDLQSKSLTVRAAGYQSIGNLGAEAKGQARLLCEGMLDPEPAVRVAAADALGKVDGEIHRLALGIVINQDGQMIDKVGAMGAAAEPLVPLLLALAQNLAAAQNGFGVVADSFKITRCVNAAVAIAPDDAGVSRAVVNMLGNSSAELRAAAVQLVPKIRNPTAALPGVLAIAASTTNQPEIRAAAVALVPSLVDAKTMASAKKSVEALRFDTAPAVRDAVSAALSALK